MRIGGMIILLLVIQLGIVIFDQTTNDSYLDLRPTTASAAENDTNMFWNLAFSPNQAQGNSFITYIVGLIIGGALLALGATIFGFRTDTVLLWPVGVFIYLAGIWPITSLYSVVYRESSAFACNLNSYTATAFCAPATIASFFLSGILMLMWTFTCLEWMTGRPSV